jgi:hypothetical protein
LIDYAKIARDAGLPGFVHCKTCGFERDVDAAAALASGWPECCGATMALGRINAGGASS